MELHMKGHYKTSPPQKNMGPDRKRHYIPGPYPTGTIHLGPYLQGAISSWDHMPLEAITPKKEHGTTQEAILYLPRQGTWGQTGSEIIPPSLLWTE